MEVKCKKKEINQPSNSSLPLAQRKVQFLTQLIAFDSDAGQWNIS